MSGEFKMIGNFLRATKIEEVQNRLLNSRQYRTSQRSKMVVYEYLKSKIVREPHPGVLKRVYDQYYHIGRLATSFSLRELAEEFGYADTGTIREFIKQLADDGIMAVEQIHVGKTRPQHVFVLGAHDADGEHYFIEEVYLN